MDKRSRAFPSGYTGCVLQGYAVHLGPAGFSPGVITFLLRSVAIPELGTQSPGHGELIAAVGVSRCSGPAER